MSSASRKASKTSGRALGLRPEVRPEIGGALGVSRAIVACVVVAATMMVAMMAGTAAADVVGADAGTLTADSGWSLFSSYGPFWGSVALAYPLARHLLVLNGSSGWLSQGRVLAALTGAVTVLGTVVQWHFEGAPAAGILAAVVGAIALIWHPTVPRRATETAVAILVVIAVAAAAPACAARQAAGAGVGAGLDCEAPGVKAYLADATVFAIQTVVHWISGSGQVDRDGLASDAARIRTDLGRCALDAAIAAVAAWSARGAPDSALPEAAPMAVDAAQLASTYAEIRAGLGWPAARVAGGPS
jgi:hypothetical protein